MEEKIIIPKNTTLEITENFDGILDREINIEIEPGASLKYFIPQKKSGDIKIKRSAIVHSDAKIIWFDFNEGESTVQSEIITKLIGPGARGETYGLFYGKDKGQFNISHNTEHLAPNTHSIMETRGVLDGHSRAAMRSLIKIHPGIAGCSGHERADTLLLSKNAHIDVVPDLEIGNNDVQCTHAVTTTRLSPEKLFYLAGRGIGEDEAKKMLVEAHLAGVVEKNILLT